VTLQEELSKIDIGQEWLEAILAGGPGSGCHGDNCGRPPGSGSESEPATTGPAATTGSFLKQSGWSKGEKTELKGQPATTYTHPTHGTLTVSKSWFEHHDPTGTKVGEKTDLAKGTPLSSKIEKYLGDKKETTVAPTPAPTPTPVAKPEPPAPEPKPVEKPPEPVAPPPAPVPAYTPNLAVKRNMTDEQIVQRVHDDRLLKVAGGTFSEKQLNFDGMTPDDRLAYLNKIATYRKDSYKTDVPQEFTYKDYSFLSGVKKDATPAEIRDHLLKTGFAKPSKEGDGAKQSHAPTLYTNLNEITKGLNEKEKDELADKLPAFFKQLQDEGKSSRIGMYGAHDADDAFSVPQFERISDGLDKIAGVKGFAGVDEDKMYTHNVHEARNALWKYSSDYEVARYGLFGGWASSGGGTTSQLIVRDATSRVFPVNHGIKFYDGANTTGKAQSPKYSESRMDAHILTLKKETEDFYKAKLKTNDLSTKKITLVRGVGNHVEAYTPAASESWTTDKNTAERFGKMMSPSIKSGPYSTLETETTMDNVLWTYASAKGQMGWPEEKDLKGKKEFVLLGGAIKDVKVEHKYAKAKKY
jgi:outer membrane biosynthesis protein TonB